MGMYIIVKTHVILLPSQLMVNPKNEGTIEGIIRNYYDREDGETTPRFESIVQRGRYRHLPCKVGKGPWDDWKVEPLWERQHVGEVRAYLDVDAQTRFEITSKKSNDPPLSRGYTLGSGEDNMKLLELMELCTQLSYKNRKSVLLMRLAYVKAAKFQVPAADGDCINTLIQGPKFAEIHNVVAFLEKPVESDGFVEIIDFLKASSVHYALMVNPIIYTSCIEQFWATAIVQMVNWSSVTTLMAKKGYTFGEIATLKKRVQRLERKKKSKTTGLKRLKKVGMSRRVESSKDQESLVDENQERQDEDLMFDTGVLDSDEIPVEAKIDEKDEQSTKLDDNTAGEAVTAASVEDKGKAIMVEPKVPLKRKDQVALDEQMARDVQAQLEAELIEEEKLARKQEEEANIALIESWDNTQAMMEADFELAQRLQTEEQGEITIEERSRLFVELMNKRKKHFAMLRAEEKKRKPPTKAQKRNQMSTYLKNMGGYKHNQLKSKSYEEIQKMFANEMRRVNTFIPMDSEVVKSKKEIEESSKGTEDELESDKLKKAEGSEEKTKGSRKKMLGRKRAGKEQQQESSKKQRLEEDKESDEVEEDDEDALKKYLVIKKDDDIAIDVIPLATKLPVIVDYKLHKEGLMAAFN
ncbi:hypothetical protein Tco_0686094 [Tanacetum coccineum]